MLLVGLLAATAETYELLDGQVMTGPPVSITKDGVAFRDSTGSQGARVGYTNLTQEALRELQKNPKAKKFVADFIEAPLDSTNKNRVAFELKPFERLEKPDAKSGLGGLAKSGLGFLILALLFAANLYSAYEVGIFRNYSPYMVAGISVILPIITQIVFVCLPTYVPKSEDHAANATSEHVPGFTTAGGAGGAHQEASPAAAAAGGPAAPAALPHYKRGEFTFNKRFFETKMGGFYGVRAADAEKGYGFDLKSNRGVLTCSRIIRINPSEICLQVQRGATMEEVSLPFTEIIEIEIKKRA
ncbi:MAG TPA: hypothetical protein DCM86_19015 [Verrucomicrobiales bacterium]|nr:hypothetical protein [Verrucomicrobiales bacterium]